MPLIKILVSVFMVLTLSLIADFVSPRIAGILSGYPLGAAISLFFIGFEIGPGFASESALYTMTGLVGIQGFIYSYYLASSRVKVYGIWFNITVSSLERKARWSVERGLISGLLCASSERRSGIQGSNMPHR